MKRVLGGVAALALLLSGCGSSTAPVAQTVTSTASVEVPTTVQVTVEKTTENIVTKTVATTLTAITTKLKPIPTTVLKTAIKTAPTTVKVTVTAEPAGASVSNGDYLVGKDIEPGTYQCKDGGSNLYWEADDNSGEIIDNDLGSIARFTSDAYTIKLSGCAGDWKRAG